MRFPQKLKVLILLLALVVAAAFVASCRGSKANVRKEETKGNTQPAAVEGVTTAAAIKRTVGGRELTVEPNSIERVELTPGTSPLK